MENEKVKIGFFDKHPVLFTAWISFKLWFYILCLFTATKTAVIVYQEF